jgi:hypothetical protein
MKKLLAVVIMAAPLVAQAEVGGFIEGGVNFTALRIEDDFDSRVENRIEFDDGTGFNLTGGLRFTPGLMLKASYSFSEHDGGDVFRNGRRIFAFDNEIEADELRVGFYYAPPQKRVVGFRVGGGYERVSIDAPDFMADEAKTDGLFVEAALLLNAGQVASFDIGGAVMAMEDDRDNDAVGLEFRAGVTFHTGPVDIGLAYRFLGIATDNYDFDDDSYYDDDYYYYDYEEEYSSRYDQSSVISELRLTVSGKWGYPKK